MSASITQGGASGGQLSPQPPNALTLVAGGYARGGWQSIRVTRGLSRFPSDFDISATERYPNQPTAVTIKPGDACQVYLGNDVIINGYVDRYRQSFSPNGHQVRITGRSKCEDLVDCSVTPSALNGMSMSTTSLLDLASALAKPFGITASSLTGGNVPVSMPGGGPLTFNAILTETPYEIVERVARYAGVLVFDGTDGNLVLANVGTSTMASGFQQGRNVQAAAFSNGMDQRYSEYLPCLMSTNFYGQEGAGGISYAPSLDSGVTRYRPLIVVSEQFQFGESYAVLRAQWEAARRYGQAQSVRLTCDSWRDQAGTLWAPNAYATINLPALKLTPSDPWIIGEVTFKRDQGGTMADLTLMPKEAFMPQPDILVPQIWDPTTGSPPPAGGAAAANAAPYGAS